MQVHAELIALEGLAVSMFESFMRRQATEGRGKSVRDWYGLQPEERTYWRGNAAEMVEELTNEVKRIRNAHT